MMNTTVEIVENYKPPDIHIIIIIQLQSREAMCQDLSFNDV